VVARALDDAQNPRRVRVLQAQAADAATSAGRRTWRAIFRAAPWQSPAE
jgi:hypothetical protein